MFGRFLLDPLECGLSLGFGGAGALGCSLAAAVDGLAVNAPMVEPALKESREVESTVKTVVPVLRAIRFGVEGVQDIAGGVVGAEEGCQDPREMAGAELTQRR